MSKKKKPGECGCKPPPVHVLNHFLIRSRNFAVLWPFILFCAFLSIFLFVDAVFLSLSLEKFRRLPVFVLIFFFSVFIAYTFHMQRPYVGILAVSFIAISLALQDKGPSKVISSSYDRMYFRKKLDHTQRRATVSDDAFTVSNTISSPITATPGISQQYILGFLLVANNITRSVDEALQKIEASVCTDPIREPSLMRFFALELACSSS